MSIRQPESPFYRIPQLLRTVSIGAHRVGNKYTKVFHHSLATYPYIYTTIELFLENEPSIFDER